MPLTAPRNSTIGIVGDGFGSLMVFATAVFMGFDPDDITVFGPSETPVETYQELALNLRQTLLRSESESHFLPADWPTFAELDAWSRRSLAPLVRSVRRRYNPSLLEMMAEAKLVARGLRWDDNRMPARIGWIERKDGGNPHFAMYDEAGSNVGQAKHVILTLGHGPLSFPPILAKAREHPALAGRIVHAYEQKDYVSEGRYVVIGAGIAAVNEWINGLDAGAKVLSLLRRPAADVQDLNTPRCMFEALGIDRFGGVSIDDRLAFLRKILKGTSPARRKWTDTINRGRSEGRFDQLIGEIDRVEPGPAGLRIHVASRFGPEIGWLDVSGVVAGTGFNTSVLATPLLRRLIDLYGLQVREGRIVLRGNCGVPGLDRADSRLCMMGIQANTVIPHGDTIAGLKYIARRFVADCVRAERISHRPLPSRLKLQLSLASLAAKTFRDSPRLEQLA
jgi:hypothetical protein